MCACSPSVSWSPFCQRSSGSACNLKGSGGSRSFRAPVALVLGVARRTFGIWVGVSSAFSDHEARLQQERSPGDIPPGAKGRPLCCSSPEGGTSSEPVITRCSRRLGRRGLANRCFPGVCSALHGGSRETSQGLHARPPHSVQMGTGTAPTGSDRGKPSPSGSPRKRKLRVDPVVSPVIISRCGARGWPRGGRSGPAQA